MASASKTFPPGEAPAAEARAEAALARELAPDSAPLDIALDEAPGRAGTARARRGGDQGILAPCAAGAGRLPDDRGRGRGALCRQGALDQEAHRRLHGARTAAEPHRPHGRANALDGVRHHRIGRRGAAARGQSHQAAEAPLQRDAARRQELPLYPDLHRTSGGAAHQAPRRALARGRLFRPVRQRGRGVPHPQRAAAGVPSAHLLGQFLRQPHPALPALSDQALLGALHGRDRARRLREAGLGGARFSLRPQPRDQGPPWPRNERGRGGARFRKRGAIARPHQRALGDPGRAERQSALDRRSRRVRGHRGGGAVLRRSVLLPHLPELGQPRLFPARRPGARSGGSARRLSGPVLSRPAGAAARAAQSRRPERRDFMRSS